MRKYATRNCAPHPPAYMESVVSNELLGAEKMPRFAAPVCIHVHSVRGRLADPDGLSCKAILDGLVMCGILADDSAKQIKEIRQTQELGKPEKTIITITDD